MATVTDVARLAGVSQATVSRVLNRPEIVTAEKRARVLAAIERLKFQPSRSARSLRLGHSGSIALLVGDISQPFHGGLAKAVGTAAESRGITVMLSDLDHREDRLIALLRSLPKRGVDGAIISTADDLDRSPIRELVSELTAQGIPIVATSGAMKNNNVGYVVVDHEQLGRTATRHLIDRGSRRLVLLSGTRSSPLTRALRRGFDETCRTEPTVVLSRRSVIDGRYEAAPARLALEHLLGQGHMPDGVIAANSPMALAALRVLADAGLRVPQDVLLVCCENDPVAEYMTPSLTTVGSNFAEYGTMVVELLSEMIEGSADASSVKVPFTLIERESTGS